MLEHLLLMPLPILLLIVVFFLTAIKKIGPLTFPIWGLMVGAALIVLACNSISLKAAIASIDINIIAYLFGVFIIAEALETSLYLESLLLKILKCTQSKKMILGLFIIFCSLISIILMNDTTAIIGVPAIILLCDKTKLPPLPFLLTLAFTATISSVVSPIGNPQNLLIANTIEQPFIHFFRVLTLPTLINLVILFLFILLSFKKNFKGRIQCEDLSLTVDSSLAWLGKLSLAMMFILLGIQIVSNLLNYPINIPFGLIAIISASPILLFSKKRIELIKNIDWSTLAFFIGIFIFIESVWLTGYFQTLIEDFKLNVIDKHTITSLSLFLSPLISNVPLVALYLPLLKSVGINHHLILALSSTLAGNLVILGAASNVIIVQNCEKRKVQAFSFFQFMLYGMPLTIVNIMVYLLFI